MQEAPGVTAANDEGHPSGRTLQDAVGGVTVHADGLLPPALSQRATVSHGALPYRHV
jgi:hypothetical protein